MVKHGKDGSRHRPERGHGNIPLFPQIKRPVQKRVRDDEINRRFEPVEEPLKRLPHLSLSSSDEAGHVGGALFLGRQDVGDGGEVNAGRLLLGADDAEPLLRDDDGDAEIGVGISE